MDDLDRLLRDAGIRWRATQPPPPEIEDVELRDVRRGTFGWQVAAAAGMIGAGAAIVVVLAFGARSPGLGAPESGAGRPDVSPTDVAAIGTEPCSVTRPLPPFAAPPPYPPSPPFDGYAWFGTPELWTALELDGDWDASIGEKTFWWSSNYAGMRVDEEPDITVVATRLDGSGTVTSDQATNAGGDSLGGDAMLVGINFPSPGCWQLTAEYEGALLSYVLWIDE